MAAFTFSWAVVIRFTVIMISYVNSSVAQNAAKDYLVGHNAARSQVGVGPISWSNTLVAYAQNYANKVLAANTCNKLVHSEGPYGENLAAGTGDFTGKRAVELWVAEKPDYDYKSNKCTSGKACGHYTQVVWRDSVRLGCARVVCANGWAYVICSYDPPGNFVGERPY